MHGAARATGTSPTRSGRTTLASCKKCSRTLNDCQACNGGRASGMFGKLTCSKCNNTGLVCSQHNGHWK